MDNRIISLQEIYKTSYEYLVSILPAELKENDLHKYFFGDRRDYDSLNDVFEQFIASAQNYRSMPKTIQFYKRYDAIKRILYDFDYKAVKLLSVDELTNLFRTEFNIQTTDNKYNSWRKWSRSIIEIAEFVNEFKDVDDFRAFVNQFSYNKQTRIALPLLISTKIYGIGFALACDSLKELGYTEYPKPDVHLMEVFSEIELSKKEPIDTFEAIVKMAEECGETPYKVDKVFWLICSGEFYLDKIKIPRHKDSLIAKLKSIYNYDT